MVARLVHHFKEDEPDKQFSVSDNTAACPLVVTASYGHSEGVAPTPNASNTGSLVQGTMYETTYACA